MQIRSVPGGVPPFDRFGGNLTPPCSRGSSLFLRWVLVVLGTSGWSFGRFYGQIGLNAVAHMHFFDAANELV